MPTGYTHKIKDGITFDEYAMGCARAFGACFELRETPSTPIPEEFKVNPYHLEKLLLVDKEKVNFLMMNHYELVDVFINEKQKRWEDHLDYKQRMVDLESKYTEMLEEVNDWDVPDDLMPLRDLMKEQIESSIKCDCYDVGEPVDMTFKEWETEQLNKFDLDIDYHKKYYEKEVAKVEKNNIWTKSVRDSLQARRDNIELGGMDDDQLLRLGL